MSLPFFTPEERLEPYNKSFGSVNQFRFYAPHQDLSDGLTITGEGTKEQFTEAVSCFTAQWQEFILKKLNGFRGFGSVKFTVNVKFISSIKNEKQDLSLNALQAEVEKLHLLFKEREAGEGTSVWHSFLHENLLSLKAKLDEAFSADSNGQTKVLPSDLCLIQPWDSLFHKSEAETIAKNIMTILARTGNKWRKLTWDEYLKERTNDKAIESDIYSEKQYFEMVVEFTEDTKSASHFSPEWT